MLDIILMVIFCSRLRVSYQQKDRPFLKETLKMIGFWLIAEYLVLGAMIQLKVDIYLAAVISMAAGVFVGWQTYREALNKLKEPEEKRFDKNP